MKSYTITVNGTAYDVTVEETGSASASRSDHSGRDRISDGARRDPYGRQTV